MFFDYIGKIKYVQFYDLTITKAQKRDEITCIVGNVITEVDYRKGMFLPQPNTLVKFRSSEYKGNYNVISWCFHDTTGVLRICVKKDEQFLYGGVLVYKNRGNRH